MTAASSSGDGAPILLARSVNPASRMYAWYVSWVLFFAATSMGVLQVAGTLPQQVAWLTADAAALALLHRYQSQFINLALSNLIFMSWPLVACLSALWSIDPATSLYFGIQLLMTTFVALLICIQFRLLQIVEIIFIAMLLAAIFGIFVALLAPPLGIDPWGNWRGGFPHKNVMGDAMVLLIVSASCLFLQGRWRLLTASAIALGLSLILLSRAATPLLSGLITLSPLPFAYALLRGRSAFFSLLGIALLAGAFVGAAAYVAIYYSGFSPVAAVLDWVGKERTLTGRTLLWELAQRAMDERPLFGLGFQSYWAHPPSEMIDVYLAFGQRLNHFHNNFLETAVAFGFLGPILLILGMLVAAARSIRRVFLTQDPIEIWPLLIIIQITIQLPVQAPMIQNHSMWHIVLIIASLARR